MPDASSNANFLPVLGHLYLLLLPQLRWDLVRGWCRACLVDALGGAEDLVWLDRFRWQKLTCDAQQGLCDSRLLLGLR